MSPIQLTCCVNLMSSNLQITSKDRLFELIPNLRSVPDNEPHAFYEEIVQKYQAKNRDDGLLMQIRDLLTNIETFYEDETADDQTKHSCFYKSAVLSFVDGANKKGIFSTHQGRDLLVQQIQAAIQQCDNQQLSDFGLFELKVMQTVKKLALTSFILQDTNVLAGVQFMQRKVPPIRVLYQLVPDLKEVPQGMPSEFYQEIVDKYTAKKDDELIRERVENLVGAIKAFHKYDNADEHVKTFDFYRPAALSFIKEGNKKQIFSTAQGREALIKFIMSQDAQPSSSRLTSFELRVLRTVGRVAKTSFLLQGTSMVAEIKFPAEGTLKRKLDH